MADSNKVLRAWEECELLSERGSRIVHYILRDTMANCLLAVVGTERSIRHMIYSVSDDFLRVFGSTDEINLRTRWRARREVVEWLGSVASAGGPLFTNPNQQIINPTPTIEYLTMVTTRFSTRSRQAGEGSRNNESVEQNSDIVWLGEGRKSDKDKNIHYSGFCRDDTHIPVNSFVWIMGQKNKEHIAYVDDLYETKQGEKTVRVRWFHLPEEINKAYAYPNLEFHPREVFITRDFQDISAECIDGLASVLTPTHFDKWSSIVSEDESVLCYRELREGKAKPYCVSKLRGYATQPIISCLLSLVSGENNNTQNPTDEPDEAPEGPGVLTIPGSSNQAANREPSRETSKIKRAGKVIAEDKFPVPKPPSLGCLFKIDDNIEVLSRDSGMRGCWFRCKILKQTEKHLRVQYYDVLEFGEPEKLEEWVPSSRVADADKLGMRRPGRLTVRPWPVQDSADCVFEVGAAVDAWWNDGWWEGVVIGYATSGEDSLQVYSPGENKFLTVERKDVRVSRDWVKNKWVKVKTKPDILLVITSCFNPMPDLSRPLLLPEPTGAPPRPEEVEVASHLSRLELPPPPMPPPSSSSAGGIAIKDLPPKKRLLLRYYEEMATGTYSGNNELTSDGTMLDVDKDSHHPSSGR